MLKTTRYELNSFGAIYKNSVNNNVYEDDIVDVVYTDTRDAFGRLIKSEVDTNGDNISDFVTTYTLNALGQRVKEEFDTNGDNIIGYYNVNTFDQYGKMTNQKRYILSSSGYEKVYDQVNEYNQLG